MNYCPNCGKEVKEGADICLKCGKFLNVPKKTVKCGRGFSITSFVVSLVALLSCIGTFSGVQPYYQRYNEELTFLKELAGFIDYTIFPMLLGITGLVFGIIGYKKQKNGLGLTGIILSVVSLVLLFIEFLLYIMA